ncbi:PREDICTED: serine/threonine-protein phosphatase 4 regulatory subunit 1-like [Priapulus caudatus]|uniref:Serine/threonine-protein phosphatase 4 regulatory subunit 1-like n=1 Tax=Priapulus caudatus TaxID=37621 RepID=A0ABM1EPE3_PRICU|nr:PREDICTED: serine/threonine-protein phosphatase 4 regulatory subunit 1-like [Priapulus caudatus]
MQVSCAVSPSIRRRDLAPLFISLICDQSRWVRMAAFQALGPFISTFADPASTGLIYYEDTGHLAEHNRSNAEKSPPPAAEQPAPSSDEKTQSGKTSSSSSSSSSQQQQQQQGEVEDMEVDDEEEEWERSGSQKEAREEEEAKLRGNLTMSAEEERVARMLAAAAADSKVAPPTTPPSGTEAEAIETFNAFNYWRTPIADLDLTAAAAGDDGGEDRDDDDGSPALHMARLVSSGGDYDAIERGDGSTEASQTPAAAAAPPPTQMFSTLHMEPAGGAGGERDDSKGLQRNGVVPNAAAAGRVDPARLTNSPASSRAFHVETPNFFSGHIAGVDTNRLSYIDESESDNSFCDAAEKRGLSHDDGEVVPQQEQIPQSLLEKFTSMTQIILAQTVDTEIAKHCAYSLPAVAYTLGRCNWSCLKNTYETLASDMQWKVRRTLAFSNHELAVILGPDITAKDLVPIFNGFLKDLDEVRVGVLKHLFDFLKVSALWRQREGRDEVRVGVLKHLFDFLKCLHLCQLFTPGEISEHIVPVAMVLASDKVSDVRCMSYKLLGVILRSLRNSENLMQGFVNDLIEGLALSYRWSGRHGFAMRSVPAA